MFFHTVLNDWHGHGSLTAQDPTTHDGQTVLVLGDPSDPHRGPVGPREVAHLRLVEATEQERAELKLAGYVIPDE